MFLIDVEVVFVIFVDALAVAVYWVRFSVQYCLSVVMQLGG